MTHRDSYRRSLLQQVVCGNKAVSFNGRYHDHCCNAAAVYICNCVVLLAVAACATTHEASLGFNMQQQYMLPSKADPVVLVRVACGAREENTRKDDFTPRVADTTTHMDTVWLGS